MPGSPPPPSPPHGIDVQTNPVTQGVLIDLLSISQGGATNPFQNPRFNVPDRIYFVHTPDYIDESKSAEYAAVNVIGRSEPMLGYSHSSPRTFQIPLVFVATRDPFEEVIKPIWLIRSWVYPDYSDLSMPNVPPRVLLVMGSWLKQRCVATRVDIRYNKPWARSGSDIMPENWDQPDTWGQESMIPYKADVNLTLQETTENTEYTPWDTGWVRRGWDRGGVPFL